jgi:hypothetical protein
MTNDKTYKGREQQTHIITDDIYVEWHVSNVDKMFSGPIIGISAPGKTVEFRISEHFFDEIVDEFVEE